MAERSRSQQIVSRTLRLRSGRRSLEYGYFSLWVFKTDFLLNCMEHSLYFLFFNSLIYNGLGLKNPYEWVWSYELLKQKFTSKQIKL